MPKIGYQHIFFYEANNTWNRYGRIALFFGWFFHLWKFWLCFFFELFFIYVFSMALMLGCPKIKNIHTYNMENSVSKQQTIRLKMEIKIIWKTQWLICEYIISEIIHEKHAKELPHSDFIFKTIRTFELFFGYLPISQLCCTQIVDLVWDQHPVFMPAEPAGLNMISACSCARISEDQAIDMLVWALCFHHGMLGLGIGEVISAQDIMYSNCCVDANFRKVNQRPNFFFNEMVIPRSAVWHCSVFVAARRVDQQ